MTRTHRNTASAFALLGFLASAAGFGQGLAAHPDELEFPPLEFEIPKAEDHRHELSNGSVAYVVEDGILPLFTVGVRVRVGAFLEPDDKVGLASLTGRMMRVGGAGDLDGAAFDERAAFLAAQLDARIGETSGSASVNCLTTQRDECLDLFFEMMRSPRFDGDRLRTEKLNLMEELRQRNDDPAAVSQREFEWLLYGREHFSTRRVTGDSLAAIDRRDLEDFHRAYWRPESMIWTVSGDVDTGEILAAIEERLQEWPTEGAKDVPWPPPPPRYAPTPGVYYVEKEIPQGRVLIGQLTARREDWLGRDEMAVRLMNEILGGGGFTSRLTKRIRSDEGLAYSAGSSFTFDDFWPGRFLVSYQSKSETVAYAAEIAFEELERMRTGTVTDDELKAAKAAFRDTLPQNFESAATVANLFATDDLIGRPHTYWSTFQERVDAVTAEDVVRVAREYLRPEEMVFLVVGEWEPIAAGDADGRATMEQFFDGRAKALPRRDPVSLEPIPPR